MERIDSVRVQQKEAEKLGVDGDAIAIQRISLFRASKKIKRERERRVYVQQSGRRNWDHNLIWDFSECGLHGIYGLDSMISIVLIDELAVTVVPLEMQL